MIFWKRIYFLIFFSPLFCNGQAENDSISKPDSAFKPDFSFTTNPCRLLFDDLNLSGEFRFIKKLSVGIGGGKIYPHSTWNFLVADHSNWPGTVYTGCEFKLFMKFYPFGSPAQTVYFSLLYQY